MVLGKEGGQGAFLEHPHLPPMVVRGYLSSSFMKRQPYGSIDIEYKM